MGNTNKKNDSEGEMPPSKRASVDHSGALVKALSDKDTPVSTLEKIIREDSRAVPRTPFENGESCLHFYIRCHRTSVEGTLWPSLLQAWPAGLLVPNDQGSLPLHVAITEDACIELISLLVEKDPAACQVADQQGRFPLTLAMAVDREDKMELWKLLVEAWPIGLILPNEEGYLPLHTALLQDPVEKDLIKFLVDKAPETCKVVDNQGRLPLHLAKPKDRRVYECLMEAFPDGLMTPDTDSSLALHKALTDGASPELVQMILLKAPGAVKIVDGKGRLPLQLAKPSDREVYESLLEAFPESIEIVNTEGSLPLHVALAENAGNTELVQKMLEKAPATVKVADGQGRLPLELAYCAEKEVYERLIELWPESLLTPTENGSLALHTVLKDGVSSGLIRHLVEKAPEAVKVYDNQGRFPLQLACERCTSLDEDTVKALVDVWPESVQTKLNDGDYVLHKACEKYLGKDAIDVLIKAWPDALLIPDQAGNTPLHLLCTYVLLGEVAGAVDEGLFKHITERCAATLQITNGAALCPIHLALEMPVDRAPTIVKLFLAAAPETLLLDVYGRGTVMHLACQLPWFKPADFQVYLDATKGCPSATKQTDIDGTLPLHQFMNYCQYYEERRHQPIFMELVKAYPESLGLMDQAGSLPLHFILEATQEEKEKDLAYLDSLVKLNPEAFAIPSLDGELVLHKACKTASWAHRVPLILAAYPEAIQTQSAEGWNPLCLAIRAKAEWETIDALITAWPESTTVQVNDTYPLLLACEFEYSLENLSFLMKRSLDMFADFGRISEKPEEGEESSEHCAHASWFYLSELP